MKLSEKDKKLATEVYRVLVGDTETANKPLKRSDTRGLPAAGRNVSKVKPATASKTGTIAPRSINKGALKIVWDKGRLVITLKGKKELPLPRPVTELIIDALEQLGRGEDVTLTNSSETSAQKEVTTQQAADYLRVSRPFVVSLLENGKIPFHKVGTHRRISFEDLRNFKEGIDAKRLDTLAELAKQAQELGMGY